MRSPKLLLLAAALAFAGGNVWVTLARSTIPLSIDGTVENVDVRFEKHPGVDDVYLVTVNGRRLHVDRAVGIRLRPGMQISKDAGDRILRTSRGPVALRPSQDLRHMVVAMPLVILAAIVLLVRPGSGGAP